MLELQACIPALKGFVKRPPEGVLACQLVIVAQQKASPNH